MMTFSLSPIKKSSFPSIAAWVNTLVVSWKEAADKKESVAKEAFVSIRVTDNGIGVPNENKERIFEPQFTTKSSGMGLGLGMVKNIVERYGGTISLTSTSEKTTFEVSFPAIQ